MTDTTNSNLDPNRKCGACNACCTHIGIDELHKRTGERCQYLNTKKFGSHHCCTIYDERPKACATFYCGWRVGIGPDTNGRPDTSGILISMYLEPMDEPDIKKKHIAFTVNIIDSSKCGNLESPDSLLRQIIQHILDNGHSEIRIINPRAGNVIHFSNGEVRVGKLFPQKFYEDLSFEIYDPPVGYYMQVPKDKGDTPND